MSAPLTRDPAQPRRRVLTTPEGLVLPLTLGSRGARAGALVLDLMLIGFLELVVTLVAILVVSRMIGSWNSDDLPPGLELLAVMWIAALFLFRYGYFLYFELGPRGATPGKGPNYTELSGVFDVTRGGSSVTRLVPEKRIYDAPPQPTTEAGIHNSWRGDLYVVLGDQQANGGFAIRLYFHPFVRFIWIGTLFMFVGGGVSISDRRLRVGAPMRARKAPANAVPAE